MSKNLIILGSGGHASVLVEAIRLSQQGKIIGFTDKGDERSAGEWEGIPSLGHDERIAQFDKEEVRLVNGLGSVGDSTFRRQLFATWRSCGYHFATVVHPSAIISPNVQLHEGVQLMAGAVIQTGVHIAANTIVNTRALVDHHCVIGAHSHIAPGAVLCGNVHVGSGVHIGAGAVVKQGVRIEDGAIIGAGAVVIKEVKAGQTVIGIPAREVQT